MNRDGSNHVEESEASRFAAKLLMLVENTWWAR